MDQLAQGQSGALALSLSPSPLSPLPFLFLKTRSGPRMNRINVEVIVANTGLFLLDPQHPQDPKGPQIESGRGIRRLPQLAPQRGGRKRWAADCCIFLTASIHPTGPRVLRVLRVGAVRQSFASKGVSGLRQSLRHSEVLHDQSLPPFLRRLVGQRGRQGMNEVS